MRRHNLGTVVKAQEQRPTGRRRRVVVAIAILAASVLTLDPVAMGQDQSAATAKDVIWARKILMATIGDNSDQIRSMISERNIDLNKAQEAARNISVMLKAFPHLFPPASNQWKEGVDTDPVTDTIASPDIWTDFSDFYRLAAGVANIADEISHADSEEEVRNRFRALGIYCDLCHALYLKE
jgi:cytochrome c556